MKDGGGTNKPANAAVKIFNDGSVLLSSGSVEIGQGMRTAFLQVVAEELSVPTERVRVAALDTHYTPFDKGTNASSATAIMGQAVQKAAQDARAQFLGRRRGFSRVCIRHPLGQWNGRLRGAKAELSGGHATVL